MARGGGARSKLVTDGRIESPDQLRDVERFIPLRDQSKEPIERGGQKPGTRYRWDDLVDHRGNVGIVT